MNSIESLDSAEFELLRPAVDLGAIVRSYGDETVAWSARASRPGYLSPVATIVYRMLDGSATVGEIIDDIHDVVGVPRASAADLMSRILAQLDNSALLTTSAPTWPTEPGQSFLFPAPHNH